MKILLFNRNILSQMIFHSSKTFRILTPIAENELDHEKKMLRRVVDLQRKLYGEACDYEFNGNYKEITTMVKFYKNSLMFQKLGTFAEDEDLQSHIDAWIEKLREPSVELITKYKFESNY